jgi:hypothetical protein
MPGGPEFPNGFGQSGAGTDSPATGRKGGCITRPEDADNRRAGIGNVAAAGPTGGLRIRGAGAGGVVTPFPPWARRRGSGGVVTPFPPWIRMPLAGSFPATFALARDGPAPATPGAGLACALASVDGPCRGSCDGIPMALRVALAGGLRADRPRHGGRAAAGTPGSQPVPAAAPPRNQAPGRVPAGPPERFRSSQIAITLGRQSSLIVIPVAFRTAARDPAGDGPRGESRVPAAGPGAGCPAIAGPVRECSLRRPGRGRAGAGRGQAGDVRYRKGAEPAIVTVTVTPGLIPSHGLRL